MLMIWVRKGIVHLLGLILLAALLVGAISFSLNTTVGSPTNIKKQLEKSKIYSQVAAATLDNAQKNGSGDSSISLNDPTVKQAASSVFTPQLIQTQTEHFIDANYDWLNGKTAKPQFSLDFSGAKQSFAAKVGQLVQTRLVSLPVCTPAQQAQLQIPIDATQVNCRPPSINPKAEGERVANSLASGNDILSNPVLTADNLNQAGDNPSNNSEPYYRQLSSLPKFFQLTKKLPWLAAIIALVTAIGIIFIAPTRRKGWRRNGVILSEAGLLLVISKFVADWLVSFTERKLASTSLPSQLNIPRNNFVRYLESQLANSNFIIGLIFLILALTIFIYLFKTRRPRPRTPNEPLEESPTAPLPAIKPRKPKPKPRLIQ